MTTDVNILDAAAAIQVTQTTQAAAYVTGNCIGGLISFLGAARTDPYRPSTGLVQSGMVVFAANVGPACDLILFNANPTGSTITDKTALAVAVADITKIVGIMHMTDVTSLGSTQIIQAQQQAMPFVLPANTATTLYGALVCRGSATLTGTSDATVTIRVLQG